MQYLAADSPANPINEPLWAAGAIKLLSNRGVAIVGSRNAPGKYLNLAYTIGQGCAANGLTVVSGGAIGVDRSAMAGCLQAGGTAVGFLHSDLAKQSRNPVWFDLLNTGRLCLVLTGDDPHLQFTAANALNRNKYIYRTAESAIVVHSAFMKGGTWKGAIECHKKDYAPLYAVPGSLGCDILISSGKALEFCASP